MTEADRGAVAVVVFADESSLPWLRWLRPGFRHCFVAVETEAGWIICDPLSHQTELFTLSGTSAACLVAHYRAAGFTVLLTRVARAPLRLAPLRLFTCVEAVKRVLGIHAPWVLTPWQLYRHLLRAAAVQRTGLTSPAI